jgi:hypothetical protein
MIQPLKWHPSTLLRFAKILDHTAVWKAGECQFFSNLHYRQDLPTGIMLTDFVTLEWYVLTPIDIGVSAILTVATMVLGSPQNGETKQERVIGWPTFLPMSSETVAARMT